MSCRRCASRAFACGGGVHVFDACGLTVVAVVAVVVVVVVELSQQTAQLQQVRVLHQLQEIFCAVQQLHRIYKHEKAQE